VAVENAEFMIRKTILNSLWILAILFTACKDEPEITAAIVGKWAGQEADFKINPSGIIPAFTINEDEFHVNLEFKSDGTLVLTDNKGVNQNGSYVLSGDKLTININYKFEMIELSGVYNVKTLTSTSLEAEIEKEGSYTHPDTGQEFDGKVTATLFFSRATD
jgi:hypothetical protein